MIPSVREFSDAIADANLGLSVAQIQKVALFAHILHRDNEDQNLTRILGVNEFIEGHLKDTIELLKLKNLGQKILDIGSGCGVPGLLAACIEIDSDRLWQLCDSEIGKAKFLTEAVAELEINNAIVIHGRVEGLINQLKPDTVVARAVGTVEKIAGWIWNCSTWNNLILFKSRGWESEWEAGKLTRFGKKLTVTQRDDYSTKDVTRYLISLSRNKNE